MTRVEYARRQIEHRIYRDAIGQSPGAKWRRALAFFTEHGFARRVVRKRLDLPTPLNTTDRIVMLEDLDRRFPPAHFDLILCNGVYGALFRKYTFPPLGTWRYLTDTPYRHTFDFYRK